VEPRGGEKWSGRNGPREKERERERDLDVLCRNDEDETLRYVAAAGAGAGATEKGATVVECCLTAQVPRRVPERVARRGSEMEQEKRKVRKVVVD